MTKADLSDRLSSSLRGKYDLTRELGGGGMSRVFLAVDVALARKVVVKVIEPSLTLEVSGERFVGTM